MAFNRVPSYQRLSVNHRDIDDSNIEGQEIEDAQDNALIDENQAQLYAER